MLIVADENIPYAREAFETLGEVRLVAGRKLTSDAVRDAQLLMIRSVTRVGPDLLDGAAVQFVGTATIGTDHVDESYLASRGIRFAAAPGSNADSVAEYITAALLVIAKRQRLPLAGRSLGVIGVGNVGGRVAVKARRLGLEVRLNDPPLQRRTGRPEFRPLNELMDCDFLTLHVPFEKSGPDATWHLADEALLRRMKPGAVLINSSRGAVADNAALLKSLLSGHTQAAVLDVWEGEPEIRTDLLRRVALGTPHIAGYSFDGKVNGTVMLYRAACDFLGVPPTWDPAPLLPAPDVPSLVLCADGRSDEDVLREAVLAVYPIERDDAALRALEDAPPGERGPLFDRLRRDYPRRREFPHTRVTVAGAEARRVAALTETLHGLGFAV